MKRIRELDGLRFFAIFAVLCVHFRPPFQSKFYLMSLGWMGVDLFFVLSGFLITTNLVSLRGTGHPYRVFYWRRVLRIFPPYYLVFLTIFALQFIRHIGLSATVVSHTLLFLTAFDDLGPFAHVFSVLLHHAPLSTQRTSVDNHVFDSFVDGTSICWSLSFEEIFYLAWAPVVLRCNRKTLITITTATIVLSPVLRIMGHAPGIPESFFFPFRFDELAMGSLLALAFVAHRRRQISALWLQRALLAIAGTTACLLPVLFLETGILSQMELRSALSFTAVGYSLLGAFFTAIVGMAVLHEGSKLWWARLLRAKPLVYLGTISYMMYLIHIPVAGILYSVFARWRGHHFLPGIGFALLAAALTTAVAALSWRFFEQPILKFKNASFAVSRGVSVANL